MASGEHSQVFSRVRLQLAVVLQVAAVVSSGGREGRAHCLGNCLGCYELLESLPRGPGAAAVSHLDVSRAGIEESFAFVAAPQVCAPEELFPVSLDREVWSLAALPGGASQLGFAGAAAAVRAGVARCAALQDAATEVLSQAVRVAGACASRSAFIAGSADGSHETTRARCGVADARAAFATAATAVEDRIGKAGSTAATRSPEFAAARAFIAPLGNETMSILTEFTRQALQALAEAVAGGAGTSSTSLALRRDNSHVGSPSVGMAAAAASDVLFAYRVLSSLALQLARISRQMMEHLRLAWGIRNVVGELMTAYPLQASLPLVSFSTEVYGRHWDVLEWLLQSLQGSGQQRTLRMAELGVACGPVGLHLLLRFPDLKYLGADPTIKPEVREAYRRFERRAVLHARTSEELERSLPPGEQFDLVFVDGPHTYKNVRNDIDLWHPRVRPGGILAGHDFTCAHPPLLGAVIEGRLLRGGDHINVGADGVWWWRVD